VTEDTEATTWFQRNMHFRMDCYHMERNEEEVHQGKSFRKQHLNWASEKPGFELAMAADT
jgi:hypothetical protein